LFPVEKCFGGRGVPHPRLFQRHGRRYKA
jgi:hypothetical protein